MSSLAADESVEEEAMGLAIKLAAGPTQPLARLAKCCAILSKLTYPISLRQRRLTADAIGVALIGH
jgi:hypothetical protein